MSDRVLLTDAVAPIYHNPNPTDSESIEFKHRWKGYCLFEFYETGQLRFWEGGEPKKELGRYVVVWDGEKPITFMDGMWCESEGWKGEDAVLAPGLARQRAEAVRQLQLPAAIGGEHRLQLVLCVVTPIGLVRVLRAGRAGEE